MADPTFKPTAAQPVNPGEERSTSGQFVNPPTFVEMGGLDRASKVKKAPADIMALGAPGEVE